jgi:hypothetical protein
MLKQLEIEALEADIKAISSLLESTTEDEDPIGYMQFQDRKEELEHQLAEIKGRHDPLGSVGLFFGGDPVIDSRGIIADFGAKAVKEFQNVVAMRLASRNRPLGRRGPVPQTDRAQLLITDAVRGSFGFVLEEHGPSTAEADDTDLKEVMAEVADLLNKTSTQDEAEFEEAKDEMDDRVFGSIQSFFRLLSNEGATLRLVENDREFSFTAEAVERAKARTDNVRIDDRTVEMFGQLWIIPHSRRFELKTAGGDVVTGSVTVEALTTITEENGNIGVGALGTWCSVRMLIRSTYKNDAITHSTHRLLSVISSKNPHPEAPPTEGGTPAE